VASDQLSDETGSRKLIKLERNMEELVGDAPFTATDSTDATVKEV
jgi:hypothetical protein